ncbi:MAG: hypothetical protein J5787_07355 [Alphaproteobacteria bacterium]|nr:hypothetical protein [Alphaproteobacteria bacterium]
MAEEKNDQHTEEVQENSVPEETVKKDETIVTNNQTPEEQSKKNGGFGKVVFFLLVLIIAGLFGVPQTRETILEQYHALLPAFQPAEENVKASPAKEEIVIEAEEINSRLEQLENAREFENAEVVVATAEPQAPSVTEDPAYVILADQQKALLAEIERLRAQLDQVKADNERQIKALRAIIPNTRRFDERLAAVHAREDALEQQMTQESLKLGRLEKNKADASSVLSLMTRMEAAEQKLRVSNVEKERAIALMLAVYQLREASVAGNPFTMELQSVMALAQSFPRIADYARTLSAIAGRGVQTQTSLLRSFDTYADQAVLAETISSKQDWFHQALNSLKTLVVIRKIGASDDMTTQSILARANLAVQDKDLEEAALILKDLQGKAATAMREWTQEVSRYLTVKKTVNQMISAVLGIVYAEQLKGE